jgi:RNA polymerase sigma-70 factor, ECF subfamily
MLRITEVAIKDGTATLRIEGRLTEGTAGELLASLAGRVSPRLDLSAVHFADAVGAGVVRTAVERGGTVVGCSGYLGELLASSGSPTPRDPEDELISALRRGDGDAFEQLVRAHGGRMLAVARRFLPNEHDARDVLQEAFVAAFRSIDGFAGGAKLSTWLHRIVVNAALMKLRSRRRRREDPIDDLLPRFAEDGHHAEGVIGWDTPADELVEREEVRSVVRAAIARLPEAYRTVLVLRDIEERDTDETAALLALTPQAVKTRLHRARQALRTLLTRPETLSRVGSGRQEKGCVG